MSFMMRCAQQLEQQRNAARRWTAPGNVRSAQAKAPSLDLKEQKENLSAALPSTWRVFTAEV